MPRVKRGVTAHARHKKVLAKAKGFRGRRGNVYRIAKQAVMRAGQYAYRDRRQKKRHFRQLWITRLSAACKQRGVPYNRFINALNTAGIALNRKMLSELAISDAGAFDAIIELARPHLNVPAKKAATA